MQESTESKIRKTNSTLLTNSNNFAFKKSTLIGTTNQGLRPSIILSRKPKDSIRLDKKISFLKLSKKMHGMSNEEDNDNDITVSIILKEGLNRSLYFIFI